MHHVGIAGNLADCPVSTGATSRLTRSFSKPLTTVKSTSGPSAPPCLRLLRVPQSRKLPSDLAGRWRETCTSKCRRPTASAAGSTWQKLSGGSKEIRPSMGGLQCRLGMRLWRIRSVTASNSMSPWRRIIDSGWSKEPMNPADDQLEDQVAEFSGARYSGRVAGCVGSVSLTVRARTRRLVLRPV